jgi:ankyrin repeat protein
MPFIIFTNINKMFFNAKTKGDIDNLIAQGVDINSQDSLFGLTYLHILVKTDSSLLDYFLEQGPNTNIADKDGKTPIFYAKNVATVDKLVKHGASILTKDLDGKTVKEINPKLMLDYISYYITNFRKNLVL